MHTIAHNHRRSDLISIVAPAYNEEEGLEEFVRRIDDVMTGNELTYEIVFVNDGSTDRNLPLTNMCTCLHHRVQLEILLGLAPPRVSRRHQRDLDTVAAGGAHI